MLPFKTTEREEVGNAGRTLGVDAAAAAVLVPLLMLLFCDC